MGTFRDMKSTSNQKTQTQTGLTKLAVRRSTHQKIDRIRKARRWSFVEAVDVLADEYLSSHASEIPRTPVAAH